MQGAMWRAVALVLAVLGLALLPACSSGDGEGAGAASTTTAGAAGDDGGEITVLSYNVAGLPAEISKVNPKDHLPLISPHLDDYDVVLTQEDFDWWGDLAAGFDFVNYHDRLRADDHHPYRTEKHPGPEAAGLDPSTRPLLQVGDGLGVLSSFPFADVERRAWAGCFGGLDTSDGGAGDCLSMKGFLATTMTLADGAEVDVYTLHVEAGGSERDQQLQADDVEQLVAYAKKRSAGRAVILGGDTNLHTDGTHADSDGDADHELWQQVLDGLGLTDLCAATDCPRPGDIDKLAFRSGGGVRIEGVGWDRPAEQFRDAAGEDLSDHEPLVGTFRWSRS